LPLTLFLYKPLLITRKARSSIIVHYNSGDYREYKLRDISSIIVIGSKTNIRSDVLSLLASYNIPLAVVNKLGVSILYNPIKVLHPVTRMSQYTLSEEEKRAIAYHYIRSKLTGLKNILKYHRITPPPILYDEEAFNRDIDLLKWESINSRRLWRHVIRLLKDSVIKELVEKYEFHGRLPRHNDPFNKALSLLYALTYSVATRALLAAGLDPSYGVLHKTRYSTPLTFDYTEMYKPPCIHATINTLNNFRLELDSEGILTKASIKPLVKEYFRIITARNKNTGKTTYHYIYSKAYRLAEYIRFKKNIRRIVYIYNPSNLVFGRRNKGQ